MEVNRQGILAVQNVLKEARRIAKALPKDKRDYIEGLCAEIDALSKELAELQAKGEVCCVRMHTCGVRIDPLSYAQLEGMRVTYMHM